MLPDNFKWVEDIGTLPKMLEIGLQYIGVKEVKGLSNNPIIMDMARNIGVSDIYTADETAWCALFINHLIRLSGKPLLDTKGDKYNLLRAKALITWGYSVPLSQAKLGDVVIINRDGGGHVFLLIAFTKSGNLIGLGGNQSNMVSIAEFDKDRVIAVRRYYAIMPPDSVKRYVVNSTGQLSTNES